MSNDRRERAMAEAKEPRPLLCGFPGARVRDLGPAARRGARGEDRQRADGAGRDRWLGGDALRRRRGRAAPPRGLLEPDRALSGAPVDPAGDRSAGHTAYRRLLNPWFTADAMAKLEPYLESYANELVDRRCSAKDAFDFVADFADPFPTVIFCELAGFPAAPTIRRSWTGRTRSCTRTTGTRAGTSWRSRRGDRARLRATGRGHAGPFFAIRATAGLRRSTRYLTAARPERRARPRDDLVTKLLAAKYEGERPLTQEELEDTLFLLFMAGLDTVASVLGLIVKGFAEDPAKRREFVALDDDPEGGARDRGAGALPRDRDRCRGARRASSAFL